MSSEVLDLGRTPDVSDYASSIEEAERSLKIDAIRQASRQEIKGEEFCLTCGEELHQVPGQFPKRWCNSECRDRYEKMNAMKGR